MTDALLRDPAHLVSQRARAYWLVRALPGWLLIGGILTVVLVSAGWSTAVTGSVVWSAVGLAVLHLVVMP